MRRYRDHGILRLASFVFAGLFLLGAAVQYNDPDPVRWMALYGAAAATSCLAAMGRVHWPIPAIVGLVAVAWAATLAPAVLGAVEMGALVQAWEMKDSRIEEGREMYGLLIIAAWMVVLAVTARRRQS